MWRLFEHFPVTGSYDKTDLLAFTEPFIPLKHSPIFLWVTQLALNGPLTQTFRDRNVSLPARTITTLDMYGISVPYSIQNCEKKSF